jgi:hypothetical protein
MLNAAPNEPDPGDVDRIVREGPGGAVALAGIATLIVVAIWFAFYFFVFSPRTLP